MVHHKLVTNSSVCVTYQYFMLVDRRDIMQLVIAHSHSNPLHTVTRRCFYFQSSNKDLGFIFFILRVKCQDARLISVFWTVTYVLFCSLFFSLTTGNDLVRCCLTFPGTDMLTWYLHVDCSRRGREQSTIKSTRSLHLTERTQGQTISSCCSLRYFIRPCEK